VAVLASLVNYKATRGITDATNDTAFTHFLGVASAIVRRFCGVNPTNGFESTARTEKCDGTGSGTILLIERPVTVLTSVSSLTPSGTASAIDLDAVRIDLDAGILYLADSRTQSIGSFGSFGSVGYGVETQPNWGSEPQSWQVVYTAGYSTIPLDLQEVVMQMADSLYANVGSNRAMLSESTGAQSYTRMDAASVREQWGDALAPYTRLQP